MSTSQPRTASTDIRSGGKMVRPKRSAGQRTPYDRPPFSRSPSTSLPEPTNPNWVSRFLLSPTRFLANGAGKVLSFVFRDDDFKSESDSECGNSSGDDVDDGNDEQNDDVSSPLQDGERIAEKKSAATLEEALVKEWSSETKCKIALLLMQETFSREECVRLTSIINSRVLNTDGCTPNVRYVATLEARKWLEEKKSWSKSKTGLEHGSCVLNSDLLSHEDKACSPADLAKSYMQSRPPWASPSSNKLQVRSPLSIRQPLSREETSSVGGHSASSSKEIRESQTAGSWSMLEELRKVRSRATEEMLRSRPSSKIDWFASALDHQSRSTSLKAENVGEDAAVEIRKSTTDVDGPLYSSSGIINDVTVAQPAEDGVQANQPDSVSEKNHLPQVELGKESVLALASSTGMSRDGEELKQPDGIMPASLSDAADAGLTEGILLPNEHGGAVPANGFPSLESWQESKETSGRAPDEAQDVAVISGHGNRSQENSKDLIEDSVEVPIIQENDNIANDSQDSSSIHIIQGLRAKEQTRQKTKRRIVSKVKEIGHEEPAAKLRKYNNQGLGGRGRGRGRGQGQVVKGQGRGQM